MPRITTVTLIAFSALALSLSSLPQPAMVLANGVKLNLGSAVIAQSPPDPALTVQDISGFNGIITALAITPDGKYLIVGNGANEISLINTAQNKVIYSVSGKINDFSNIALSQNGMLMAIAADKAVEIRRVKDGQRLKILKGHTDKVSALAFSPNGEVLVSTSGGDRTIRVWDTDSGDLIETLADDIGPTTSVVFTPDGTKFITGAIGDDRTLKFWDAKTFELLKTSAQQPGFINGIAVTPDNQKLVAAVRNFVKIWDLNTSNELHSTKGPSLEINEIVVSPDSRIAATANKEGSIMLFDIASGKLMTTLKGHKGWVLSLAFSPDGKTLYSGGEDKIVKIWQLSNLPE